MPEISPVSLSSNPPSPKNDPQSRPFSTSSGVQLMIDDALRVLGTKTDMGLDELAKYTGWKPNDLEQILKLLENRGIVKLNYPASLLQGPKVTLLQKLNEKLLAIPPGEVLEKYSFSADNVNADVKIIQHAEDNHPFYALAVQTFGPYTEVLLDEMRDKIASNISIEAIDLSDMEQAKDLKRQFAEVTKKQLSQVFRGLSSDIMDSLTGQMLHRLYGLGELELLMADNNLEEIAINSSKTAVTIYHRNYGWMLTNLAMPNEEHIQNLSAQIARKNGREITNLHPILDAHLLSGDRVNATLFPISSFGNTLTIRRFSRKPWSVVDFIGKMHTMNSEMAAWLWLSMQYELSMLIAGSTASGKTSALNALCSFIPSHQRVITIEDVREITLPTYMNWNWVPLTTRNPNPEGTGGVTMLDLLLSSLRMRPDRLIVGEMRTRQEAEALFEAMHTGHSVYATIHADSAHQVLRRLTEPPISIPALEVEAIDLILVQYRDRKGNARRTYEIAEVESGTSNEQVSVSDIFRWSARGDTFEKMNEPIRLIQKLNMHTGMSEREIREEVLNRVTILDWMVKHDFSSMEQVGKVMHLFNANPATIYEAAFKDRDPQSL
jgi:flagellar protein FlaI